MRSTNHVICSKCDCLHVLLVPIQWLWVITTTCLLYTARWGKVFTDEIVVEIHDEITYEIHAKGSE